MVRAALALLLIAAICCFDLAANSRDTSLAAGQQYNLERNKTIKWRWMSEAEARAVCVRPAYLITTATQNCNRVPTVAVNYCPFP